MIQKPFRFCRFCLLKRLRFGLRVFSPFAVLWMLIACSTLEQPPFEARNELDQILVDPIEPYFYLNDKNDDKVVEATYEFLRSRFPRGTPARTLSQYFYDVGGSCHDDGERDRFACEYCANKILAERLYLVNSYLRTEILWMVEVYLEDMATTDTSLNTIDTLTFTIASGAERFEPSTDLSGQVVNCDHARKSLEMAQKYSKYTKFTAFHKRFLVYGTVTDDRPISILQE